MSKTVYKLVALTFSMIGIFSMSSSAQAAAGACSKLGSAAKVKFFNRTSEPMTMYWVGSDCKEYPYVQIPAGGKVEQRTYTNSIWRGRATSNNALVQEVQVYSPLQIIPFTNMATPDSGVCSSPSREPVDASFPNETNKPISGSWITPDCKEVVIGTLPAGAKHSQKVHNNIVLRAREGEGGPLLNEIVVNRDGQNIGFKKFTPYVDLWKTANFLSPSDATEYTGVKYKGTGSRYIYDRRTGFSTAEVYLLDVSFSDGTTVEFRVNKEFGSPEVAQDLSAKYARAIGQSPRMMRKGLVHVTIHEGYYGFGGGGTYKGLIIHRDMGDSYEEDGVLEEIMLHELTHASLDSEHINAAGWLAAQAQDKNFISDYARDYPTREDVAESFLYWFAVRYRADKVPKDLYDFILKTIPARLKYFDSQNFSMSPLNAK